MLNGERDEVVDSPRPIRPSHSNVPGDANDASLSGAYYKAKQTALRLLSYRARSRAEVRRRLEKGYPPAVIEQLLAQLEAQGYLDDVAFARDWRRSREERRPRSQRALQRELLSAGVEPETVHDALADYDDAGNAYRAALRLARRLNNSDYPEFRTKVWRLLQRRGFEASTIRDVVDRLWRDLTDPYHRAVDP